MEWLNTLLGPGVEPKHLTILQVCVRAVLMFAAALVIVRLGDKRFLSRKTAFDAVLGFIMASMFARAVNGSAPILPTLVAGLVIVLLHRVLAKISCRWHGLGNLIKGDSEQLIVNGQIIEQAARTNGLSERDIQEDLRLNGGVANVSDVALACVERNGNISVVKKSG